MTTLEWSEISGRDAMKAALEHDADLDRLDWWPTESRAFSHDLLRIALRHGFATGSGVVLDAFHAVDLGRADEIRLDQPAVYEHWSRLRASQGELMEHLMSGSGAIDEELSERVREASDQAAHEASKDLAEVSRHRCRRNSHNTGLGWAEACLIE